MIHSNSKFISWAHPLVQEWFEQTLKNPTEPQKKGWPSILSEKNTLISAPTGSGKTLSAFLVCIDKLIKKALNNTLDNKTEVIYISPLKALSNDIQKNLNQPLEEIRTLAKNHHLIIPEINVAVRTGDTTPYERQKMIKKPPHILVTTPESFYILLTAEKSRTILQDIETVIIDEIHAIIETKRGTHLSLSLERLDALTRKKPLRIGLSATQKPIEIVGDFLIGNQNVNVSRNKNDKAQIKNKNLNIINIGHKKQFDLQIATPKGPLGPVANNEMWDDIYDQLSKLTQTNRTMIVFVNTRKLSERIAHHLADRIGKEFVAAHHGSLSKKLRFNAEIALKEGKLKVLVATASLELGIDIGSIDIVCQIGSPRAINTGLQRIGRAGHWVGAVSKGMFFATTRDELLELAALIYAIRQGALDILFCPEYPLDILAQQIIASVATNDWHEDDLFVMIKQSYPYRNLEQSVFDSVITMLTEGLAGSRNRYGAYLFHDKVNNIIKSRRGSRITAITSGGAIPEAGLFTVVTESDNIMVGTLDEDFAIESNRGDIILLGTTSWRVIRVESVSGRVIVENAFGAPPSVPFWRGEAPGRSNELSFFVSEIRNKINKILTNEKLSCIEIESHPNAQKAIEWLNENCSLYTQSSSQIVEYILQGRAVLGAVPSQNTIVAERFFDEAGGMQLVIHSPFGMRINKAWGLALRKKFCRSFNFELQAAATDNGLNISLAEQHSFPLADVFNFVSVNTLKETLTQAVLQSPLFKTRFRWVASRSLALVRFRKGRKVPPNIQRMLGDDLLASVFPDAAACQDNLAGRDIELPDHPLVNEAIKDSLTEALDMDGLSNILKKIQNKEIKCLAVDTPICSVFSHEILNANPYAFLDDAPLEERRARAVDLRSKLSSSSCILKNITHLDPEIIFDVEKQVWPDIRTKDELHDFLQTIIILPQYFIDNISNNKLKNQSLKDWENYFIELLSEKRIGEVKINNTKFWYCAERKSLLKFIYKETHFLNELTEFVTDIKSEEEALNKMISGWFLHLGPTYSNELSELLLIEQSKINIALLQLENSGFILRGHFRNEQMDWCERRILARIHRLTISKLRKEIEPISAFTFYNWLLNWHHLTPHSKLHNEIGLLEIIKKCQGFEIPANVWENQIFVPRIKNYDRNMLDRLCMSGKIGFGRLSKANSCNPTSKTPISFYIYEDLPYLLSENNSLILDSLDQNSDSILNSLKLKNNLIPEQKAEQLLSLSPAAKSIYQYLKLKGASFFSNIARYCKHLESELENGLWELISIGVVTADSFDNLRGLIDRKRRIKQRHINSRFRFSEGRWTLLEYESEIEKKPTEEEKIEFYCRLLLNRYGVVFRDILIREKNIPTWRDLLISYRRLEDRGEIRGGCFIKGFKGEQFALPIALTSLRNSKENDSALETNQIKISPADPLNLFGIILPGVKISCNKKEPILL